MISAKKFHIDENVFKAYDIRGIVPDQIDVAAGYDGTFVVVECKSAIRLRKKTIAQVITELAGKKTEIQEAILEKHGESDSSKARADAIIKKLKEMGYSRKDSKK